MMTERPIEDIDVRGRVEGRGKEVLRPGALAFVAALHREFDAPRRDLLGRRGERQVEIDAGALPDFLPETKRIREDDWFVLPAPPDLADRRVEITGPVDRKMMINALNSGARCFMADFEDAHSPTWENCVQGQANLLDAVRGTISLEAEGKHYGLNEQTATLIVRPRGWHLTEKHVWIDGRAVAGALFDFGIWFFHNARELLERGSGPYLYLPKLESHLEARLWHDVFSYSEDAMGVPRGSIRATVLIETILAAFEMEEILYELGEHATGLNAGRWDYIFSIIKKLGRRDGFVLPDRSQVTMTVPFMRAYAGLLVRTCHHRGAHAIGGMAAFIPSRKDPAVNEVALAGVRTDKERESQDGFDGTWVAHPDLVPVATEVFDGALGERPNQLERTREDVQVTAAELLDVRVPQGRVTEAGLRSDVEVAIRYLSSWLKGVGAAAIHDLMEDTATAEIARSQVWQWIHHDVELSEGPRVTRSLVIRIVQEQMGSIRSEGEDATLDAARVVFDQVALVEDFVEFLTLPAYECLEPEAQSS
jgi:malate synthase